MHVPTANIPQTIKVLYGENEYEISRGTRIKSFLRRFAPDIEPNCLGAIVGGRLLDLESPIGADCKLIPVTYGSKEGARIYRATLTVMLCEAVARLFKETKISVGQSLGDGYFFDVIRDTPLTEEDIEKIENEMRAMIARKEPIATLRVPANQAIELLQSVGMKASAEIVKTMRHLWVGLVTMGNHIDLWLEPLLPTTEGIKAFSITKYENGIVLGFPPPSKPEENPSPPKNHETLFAVYRETKEWNKLLGIETVADLNRAVITGQIGEVIRVAEALHERKIANIADEIAKRKEVKLVLVAGPSGSGKTTFVKRLRLQLLAIGIKPKEISLDDYYVDRELTPRDENGDYDFECLEAIDIDLLNQHLLRLLAGEKVDTPRFSFTKGKRDTKTKPMKLDKNEILLIEGIHGLNPKLTESIHDSQKIKVYVSALTQLCIDDHHRIFTSDARLIRRTVRDRLFRGYTAAQTLHMWPRVRAGEEKHIFPFQSCANLVFNSAMVYEPAVLKVFAERFFMEVLDDDPAYPEVVRMLEFLDLFIPVFADDVPATSILREFIGNSAFDY